MKSNQPAKVASHKVVYKFFISYSHRELEEERLAVRIHRDLVKAGHEAFIDKDIPPGMEWAKVIEQRLPWCDFLIVLLSANSVVSDMVIEEVRRAHSLRRNQKRPGIIPVRVKYDGDLGYHLSAIISPLQWIQYRSGADYRSLLQKILRVVADPEVAIRADHSSTTKFLQHIPASLVPPQPMASPIPGGSMFSDDPFYIARNADALVLALSTRNGQTLTIEAPRQIGKSSLLQRYLPACQQAGQLVALIDFSLLDESDIQTYDALLSGLAGELMRELEMELESPPSFKSSKDFTHWIEDELLPHGNQPIVLAIDEVDSIFDRDYRRDFFKMLRSWQNRRGRNVAWQNLGLALSISTERHLLIDSANTSPFNVGLYTPLSPFTIEQCRQLNFCYNEQVGHSLTEVQVSGLWQLLGGQPYLMREAYHSLLVARLYDFEDLLNGAADDDSVFSDHLRALLNRLQRRPEYKLASVLRQIIRGRGPSDQMAVARLKAAGLVRTIGNRPAPANELYARFFGRVL